jgi:hypothetical protein
MPYIHCVENPACQTGPISTDASPCESLAVLKDEYVSERSMASSEEGMDVRSNIGAGKFLWYLLPPGAVGGLYGSGCLYASNSSSVCSMISCLCVPLAPVLFISD